MGRGGRRPPGPTTRAAAADPAHHFSMLVVAHDLLAPVISGDVRANRHAYAPPRPRIPPAAVVVRVSTMTVPVARAIPLAVNPAMAVTLHDHLAFHGR